eukprot:4517418-Pleurochrysis_carterae.AAC.1
MCVRVRGLERVLGRMRVLLLARVFVLVRERARAKSCSFQILCGRLLFWFCACVVLSVSLFAYLPDYLSEIRTVNVKTARGRNKDTGRRKGKLTRQEAKGVKR